MRSRPFALLMALVMLAGVAVPHAAVAQRPDADIDGKLWQLVRYRDETGSLTRVPPGIGVTLLLFDGEAFGDGACSDFEKAEYSLNGPSLKIFDPTITTRGCDDETQRVDDAFYDLLFRTGTFSIDGAALRLKNEAGETLATFTRGLVPPDPTIAPWRLERIASVEGSSAPVIEGSLPSFRFLPGGRVIGDSGCGSFLGSWRTRDSLMTIDDVAFRLDNCTNDLRDQADVILATLGEITDFTVRPAGLALEDGSGTARLALVPDIPLANRNWAPIETYDPDGEVRLKADQLQTASLRFSLGKVTGRTPCPRDYAGGNQRSGLAVTIFDIEPEAARCSKRARKSENSFKASLERVASHALRGSQLELLDVEGRPVMRLLAQPGLRDLPWRVLQLDTTPKASRPKPRAPAGGAELTIDFSEGDVLTGDTGRTTFDGFYEESGGASIRIFDARPSIAGCGGRSRRTTECRVETSFLTLLRAVDGYEMRVAQNQMVLLDGNRVSIVLEPALTGR